MTEDIGFLAENGTYRDLKVEKVSFKLWGTTAWWPAPVSPLPLLAP